MCRVGFDFGVDVLATVAAFKNCKADDISRPPYGILG